MCTKIYTYTRAHLHLDTVLIFAIYVVFFNVTLRILYFGSIEEFLIILGQTFVFLHEGYNKWHTFASNSLKCKLFFPVAKPILSHGTKSAHEVFYFYLCFSGIAYCTVLL